MKKKMIILMMISFLFLLPATVSASDTSVEEILPGVVRIASICEDGYQVGSGFGVGKAWEDTNIFVTNRHVVSDEYGNICDEVYILLDDASIYERNTLVKCKILAVTDEYPDYAIIQAIEPIEGFTALPLQSSKDVSVTSEVWAYGYPAILDESYDVIKAGIRDVTVTKGIISRFTQLQKSGNTNCIIHDAHINSGNSGGPLITAEGGVVGINTYGSGSSMLTLDDAGNAATDIVSEYSIAVEIDYVMEELDKLGISYDTVGTKQSNVSVVSMGTSNGNFHQGSFYALKLKEYEYFVDADKNLLVCPWNDADETFYLDTYERVDEEVTYINVGKDKIYYIKGDGEESDVIMEMNPDGSDQKQIGENGHYMSLQYAELSDGREMLYYIKALGNINNYLFGLCSYDLETGTEKIILSDYIIWYNLYDSNIYYLAIPDGAYENGTILKRASLNGTDVYTFENMTNYLNGYIEDDQMMLFQLEREVLHVCDLEGNVQSQLGYDIYNGFSTYGDGWIYYCPNDSKELHRVLSDGSSDMVILEGYNVVGLSYQYGYLWFADGTYDGESTEYIKTYLVSKDGENLLYIE